MEAQEERRSAEKFSDGLDGLDGSDASVSVSDSVEIEHPPRAEDAEDEKRASPASSTRAKPLETESAAVRAYRESRAAADASVERPAARATSRRRPIRRRRRPPPPRRRRRRRGGSAACRRADGAPAPGRRRVPRRPRGRRPGDARALASIRRVPRGGAW